MTPFSRAIVIVMDSVGIGELPDAAAYGDEGSDTIGNIGQRVPLLLPTLRRLGLGRVARLGDPPPPALPGAAVGRMMEASAGKDSVTGHWEMMGIVLDRPFPVFPDGFPAEIIGEFSRRIGRGVLGNKAASGTQIIDELAPEHIRMDRCRHTVRRRSSQIAAHEEVVPVPELYRACAAAYTLVRRARRRSVIARPSWACPVNSGERRTVTITRCRLSVKRCSTA